MLLTPHAITGMVIAKYEPELFPAALAAVTLHFILDAIPHKDMIGGAHVNRSNVLLRVLDTIILTGIFFVLVSPNNWVYTGIIVAFAILPDLIEIPWLVWPAWRKLPVIKQFNYWHTEMLQYSRPKVGWVLGLIPQIILVGICIYFLK